MIDSKKKQKVLLTKGDIIIFKKFPTYFVIMSVVF
jgi:hypothetical protein